MPNHPGEDNSIVYLTADDLIKMVQEPIKLDRPVNDVRLTEDAGELLEELNEHQKERHSGAWD